MLRRVVSIAFLLLCISSCLSAQATTDPPSITATDTRPLPDLATLMAAVQRRQKNDEAIERKYVYRTTVTTEMTDKEGQPKHTFTNAYDVYWTEGMQVHRSVEVNGKPLTPEAQAKEDERIKKRLKEQKAKPEKNKPDNEVPLSRFLELGSFSAPHRETVNGRPTISVDFIGDPKAKTRTDSEKVIHNVAGTVWIDEADQTVQHLQGQLINDFRLGAGMLANIGKGTSFSFSKVRVNDELWLPDTQDLRGHFRVLVLLAANAHMQVRSSDFRKLKVSSTILPGVNEVTDDSNSPPGPATPRSPLR